MAMRQQISHDRQVRALTNETAVRDCEIGALDHFLSSSGWEQSEAFGDTVEPTSDRLVRRWAEPDSAKAGVDPRWPIAT